MYIHRHDESQALAVWFFDSVSGAEWDQHFEHLRQVATWTGKTGKRACCLLVVGKSFERPDAMRRASLTALTEAPGYNPYVAFVSPNTALRAILTMFSWFQKAPKYEMEFFATAAEGTKWLDQNRGGGIGRLTSMLREVESEMAGPNRASAAG
jgi:hypothetical protein